MKKLFLLVMAACTVLCGCEKKDSTEDVNKTNTQTNTVPQSVYVRGFEFVDVAIQGKAYYAVVLQDGSPMIWETFTTPKKLYTKDLPYYMPLDQPMLLKDKPGVVTVTVNTMDTPGEYDNMENVLTSQFYYVEILEHNRPTYYETYSNDSGMRVRVYFSYK